jgi:hypothetical protein
MSNILTFTINHNSKFYSNYFTAKEERQKFRGFALPFFEKHGIDGSYYQSKTLAVKIDKEERERFADQMVKTKDNQGFYKFKAKSNMQKAWEDEVCSKVDFRKMELVDFWFLDFIKVGKYKLWDRNGVIYGYLENKYDCDIIPADWMNVIKVSEYYAAVEDYEEYLKKQEEENA